MINFELNNTFQKELPADKNEVNMPRQVLNACYSLATPRKTSNPSLVHYSKETAALLGISESDASKTDFVDIFSGNKIIDGSQPYAMCYGGHQFGNWAGQLGDGRAINLAEVKVNDKTWAIQLKGAGVTPFSRTADGLAVLRSSVREHLCSEAMFHLGVPTTRSLSLMLSGDQVLRDMLYDGNPAYEKGAIVCRVAPSFIRFGNFEIFAARQDLENLKKLTDYTIVHFYPEIKQEGKERYVSFFKSVAENTRKMVLEWQRVGFVHGVMNTDNMSILGLTIDYGPYGWLEDYDPNWTPNTTDSQHRRYRFTNQPKIALWNLVQLANALYPLVEDAKSFEDILGDYQVQFHEDYLKMMAHKLGLQNLDTTDEALIDELDAALRLTETDMTIFFRKLMDVSSDSIHPLEAVKDAFYQPHELKDVILEKWNAWFTKYQERLTKENVVQRKELMQKVNPKYVLRNYMSQIAIDAADNGDFSVIAELHDLLKKPYEEQPKLEKWFAKRPEWARTKVGCSMLSCSS